MEPITPKIPEVPTTLINREPVLVILNGAAGVVNLVLIALVLLGWIDVDGGAIAAVVAAIQSVALLLSTAIRSAVVSPATNAIEVKEALLTPVPGTPPEFP